ncbi:MAG: beta-galactosidase [Chloroflexi bacterium]|nr:beta-galactosidase [Chloroflexota bacterium]
MQIDPGNDLPRALSMLKGAGFQWAKAQIRWEELEPSKGNINWGNIDYIVNTAQASGVRLLLSVVTAPTWSRPPDTDFSVPGPPANPQDYAEFVGAMASRYQGKVNAYEIWNEENLWYEWGGAGKMNAAQYVALLKAAYIAIKAADPGAVVLTGAPTPAGDVGNLARDDVSFFREMYQAGMQGYFDAVAAHPSGYNNPPDDGPSQNSTGTNLDGYTSTFKGHWSFYYRNFENYRRIMEEFGDANKQIWFTEFGWASSPNPYSEYAYAQDNTEEEQARYLVSAFEIAKAKGYIGAMFIWNLNFAQSADAQDRYAKRAFSIINPDSLWTPRPAYYALAAMPK